MTNAAAASGPNTPAHDVPSAEVPKTPPKAIRLLLPVWGHRFIRQFLEYGLPTLLAPGNLPALAKRLPCKFVFLTSEEDGAVLRDHPAFRYLSSVCETEIELIDDLITDDNYSTTITLAYVRAIRAAGPEVTDTCFFFLISDYLVADGSLGSVLDRMLAGASGVLAGNFQVVAEDAEATFYKRFDRGTSELVLPPRDLMTWALGYLHPMTAANMVNFPLCHSIHSNRLFWRVDENTLIGRFYLMHMICIRPEVGDFVIGSSCDYSFIPEMCPSNNVAVLTDSDDYLVVEMQPRRHERLLLRMGPSDPRAIADGLSEWTTKRHRENVRFTLVFHATEPPAALAKSLDEADAFVKRIDAELPTKTQPHRNHPYWIGAMAAHRWAIRKRKGRIDDSFDGVVQLQTTDWRGKITALTHRARFWVFGRAPQVLPWHPRWPDYRVLQGVLRKFLVKPRRHVLVLSANPAVFTDWLGNIAGKTTSWHIRRLLDFDPSHMELSEKYDGCMLFLDMEELGLARVITERVRPLLSDDAFFVIDAANGRATSIDYFFNTAVIQNVDRFLNLSTWIDSIEFVAATPLRLAVLRGLRHMNDAMIRRPVGYLPFTALAVVMLASVGVLCNLAALSGTRASRRKLYSSICMTLHLSGGTPALPEFVPEEPRYWRAGRIKTPSKPATALAPEPEGA